MRVPMKKLNDGVSIPVIGFGTWQLQEKLCEKAVKIALEAGYRHIDTAHIYQNHEEIGKAIQGFSRESLFITTKLWRDFHDPKLVENACDTSLKELQMDYIDLYLVHWPERKSPLSEIVHAMHCLKEKGKVRSIGVCNATVHHIQDIFNQKLSISMNQVEFHPFLNQKELLSFCMLHDISVTAYSPIAHGKVNESTLIKQIAFTHHKTAAQVSLRWLFQKGMVVIPRSSRSEHIAENFSIFDFSLSEMEIRQIDKINQNYRIISPEFQEFDY